MSARTRETELELEELAATATDLDLPIRLGSRLYDPYAACLYGHQFFLPERVGALVPPRVRDLLGERSS